MKPRAGDYRTAAEYRWAPKLWRRRTGGSLITTSLLAAFVGGLSGSAVAFVVLVAVALGPRL